MLFSLCPVTWSEYVIWAKNGLCCHLLLVKMKDMQVMTESLPPRKARERSCFRIWLSSFVETCLYLRVETLWNGPIQEPMFPLIELFYHFWTEHCSQYCSARHTSDKSQVVCYNRVYLEQQALVKINSVTLPAATKYEMCSLMCIFSAMNHKAVLHRKVKHQTSIEHVIWELPVIKPFQHLFKQLYPDEVTCFKLLRNIPDYELILGSQ